MNLKTVKITKINPALYNPRKDLQPSDPEYQKLKKSIDKFGFVEPLIWNSRSGNLVGGHQRLKILIEEGATEAEVSVVDLDDIDEKALNLALNKIRGDWDQDKLSALLGELFELPDFDIELTGFDTSEVENMIEKPVPFTIDDFEFDDAEEPCWFVIKGNIDDYEAIMEHLQTISTPVEIKGSLDG
ncbi:MAG TPA: ParB N-terminal domain-containing protein [Caldisericia bacterium]|nr:ParB N-terminal domain-containing protein [Caldisericia bacterium]